MAPAASNIPGAVQLASFSSEDIAGNAAEHAAQADNPSPDKKRDKNAKKGKASSRRAEGRYDPYRRPKSGAGRANQRKIILEGGGNNDNEDNQDQDSGLSLGCPFWKHDPVRHKDCLKYRLTSTSYMLQHFDRVHPTQPFHCAICGECFESPGERDAHMRDVACKRTEFCHPGLTADQSHQLRLARNKLNEAERWYAMYDIIFPSSTRRPTSPYVGTYDEELLDVLRRARDCLPGWEQYPERQRFTWLRSVTAGKDDLSFLTSDAPPPSPSSQLPPGPITGPNLGMAPMLSDLGFEIGFEIAGSQSGSTSQQLSTNEFSGTEAELFFSPLDDFASDTTAPTFSQPDESGLDWLRWDDEA
ncbi:putative het and ankyrin domain protein [Phaeoacremonium minimum UCRPA7]|uniref:Putative het and ankyrin domain protein n=1 Tax=Phaeoacremonium minimum (strain UCR-PA7) TaxID=1286976 RepID=R8BV89_PHAM7|nr:putative het and ankyrin domain protein [Phaeoacremonium minimum UCRPA7]EOO03268.1 putative het and ankyrin domain protein [Phaeoacremonium minimum UCRPA7]